MKYGARVKVASTAVMWSWRTLKDSRNDQVCGSRNTERAFVPSVSCVLVEDALVVDEAAAHHCAALLVDEQAVAVTHAVVEPVAAALEPASRFPERMPFSLRVASGVNRVPRISPLLNCRVEK